MLNQRQTHRYPSLRDIISTFTLAVNEILSTARVLFTYNLTIITSKLRCPAMSKSLAILMAQINMTVGAIESNAEEIIQIIQTHQAAHDIIVFPELAITGYPPEDLLFRPELFTRVQQALNTIQLITADCHVIVGHPAYQEGLCYNTASLLHQGRCLARYHKQHLPNDGVFDEKRYFHSGEPTPCVFTIKEQRVGLCICEDIWHPGPVDQLIDAGANVMLCLNASPFDVTKGPVREALLQAHAKRGLFVVYVNLVGGQDELVFDGQSLAFDPEGNLYARAPAFVPHLQTVTWPSPKKTCLEIAPLLDSCALVYQALCCGLRDYVNKNNFPGVLLGLSGGIDSALTLAIAVDAIGAARVHAIMMPSRYTAPMSVADALTQLNTLNVQHKTIEIEPVFHTFLSSLTPAWNNAPADTTEENLQARIRGTLLMALSNKSGNLVLTTSNKSETAVGYATLYGDMCGGFSVLKDILKTSVYALAHYRNHLHPVIPLRVINRAPSAELAEHQTDQDSLPPYAILDAIITHYMEEQLSATDIIALGYEPSVVHRVITLLRRNEYKRKQAAPGVKISVCAFGRDWRYPLTSGFTS